MAEREQYPLGKPKRYRPGHVNWLAAPQRVPQPAATQWQLTWGRAVLLLLAILLAGYGAYGVLVDDLYLPAKRMHGTHYHGLSAILMFGMLTSLAAMLTAHAFDRHDPATGRNACKRVSQIALALTVLFMLTGIFLSVQTG